MPSTAKVISANGTAKFKYNCENTIDSAGNSDSTQALFDIGAVSISTLKNTSPQGPDHDTYSSINGSFETPGTASHEAYLEPEYLERFAKLSEQQNV